MGCHLSPISPAPSRLNSAGHRGKYCSMAASLVTPTGTREFNYWEVKLWTLGCLMLSNSQHLQSIRPRPPKNTHYSIYLYHKWKCMVWYGVCCCFVPLFRYLSLWGLTMFGEGIWHVCGQKSPLWKRLKIWSKESEVCFIVDLCQMPEPPAYFGFKPSMQVNA